MKSKNIRNQYLDRVSYTLIMKENDEKVVRHLFRTKKRILSFYRAQSLVRMESMSLCVKYLRDVDNTAEFTNITELQNLLTIFTEKSLLEYIYGGKW